MKTEPHQNNFTPALPKVVRWRARRLEPMLVLNMSIFNSPGGRRTFSRSENARTWV
jgi:hypothetical protein